MNIILFFYLMPKFIRIQKQTLDKLIEKYRSIQFAFFEYCGVDDIFSNSKVYEILIAEKLKHELIPGHSGSWDAKDERNRVYEYKHYKELSSNHTWTFNDFSITTIDKLKQCDYVIFAHIDNTSEHEVFDWYYQVPGLVVAEFLEHATLSITNSRKMINISKRNIENVMGFMTIQVDLNVKWKYHKWLQEIHEIALGLERVSGTKNILTSNKIWEVLVATELGHNVNPEQGGRLGAHDAYDDDNNSYEYKVSKNHSWNFQDISENVLNKYIDDKAIILAVVNKTDLKTVAIYSAEPDLVVSRLKEKLREKALRFKKAGKLIRRSQVSLCKGDLEKISATQIF